MTKRLYQYIEILWDYMQVDHTLSPSECIIVLCSNDTRVADYAAKLYLDGFAPYLIFSGGEGRFTNGLFDRSEAETFATIAQDMGVPAQAIYTETLSSNTGENVQFTHQLLQSLGLEFSNIILVQKPFMERRTLATFMKQWPSHIEKLQVTSTRQCFFDYINREMPLDRVLKALLADFERIKTYPDKGFQTKQHVPEEVEQAYQYICQRYPL
ncbi:YdcF family protein [Thaumasiovibrio sp. DFM-14]|uniref:YdcF family protein n=1 Tax=Thaumasiovibrio sp. DFM-14 TaxID=3384792 RepID=UPI0039A35ECB